MDEMKFECTISSIFDVIDRMKVKFSPRLGTCMLRGVRQVCWPPLWQYMRNVMLRKIRYQTRAELEL